MKPQDYSTPELEKRIEFLNQKYYGEGLSVVPDCEYDALIAELRSRNPESPLLCSLGDDAQRGAKTVVHTHRILSLDKIHEGEDGSGVAQLNSWINGRKVYIEPKYDGLTLVLYYENGLLIRGVTRGNGTRGEIVPMSRLKSFLPDTAFALDSPFSGTIRGEVVVAVENEAKALAMGYSNLRACAVGQLRNNRLNAEDLLIRFMPFDMEAPVSRAYAGVYMERQFGVVPPQRIWNPLTDGEITQDFLEALQKGLQYDTEYPTDGLVLKLISLQDIEEAGEPTAHHPKDAIAFKFHPRGVDTTIRKIVWQVGRTGVLTPVAEFDPVIIGGTEVRRATLSNYSNAQLYHVGDVVEVVKAGEIIPFIRKVVQPANTGTKSPASCPECQHSLIVQKGLEADNLVCPNPNCWGRMAASLVYACGKNALDIDGMGPAVARNLVARFREYVDDSLDLCAEIPSDAQYPWLPLMLGDYDDMITQIPGTKRLKECLDKRRKDAKLEQWITAMGIPHIGKTRAVNLSWRYSSLSAFFTLFPDDLKKGNIEGFGSAMTEEILNWIEQHPAWNDMYYAVLREDIVDVKGNLPENQTLKGINFVITGTLNQPRSVYAMLVKRMGGSVKENISRKTSYLVVGDSPGEHKQKVAALHKVPVISEKEFLNLLKQNEKDS